MLRSLTAFLLALPLLTACAARAPRFGYLHVVGGLTRDLAAVATALKTAIEASGTALASQPLEGQLHMGQTMVVVRDREPFHLHAHSDLIGMVVSGEGYLETTGEPIPLQAGDWVAIPKGAPHAYVNTARDGSVLLAVFAPPHVAGDRVPVPADTAADESEPGATAQP